MLSVVPMGVMNALPADEIDQSIPKPFDHDAIGQWFEDKGGETFYSDHGRWYRMASGD